MFLNLNNPIHKQVGFFLYFLCNHKKIITCMVPEKIVDKVIEYVDNSIGQMIAAVEVEDYEIASIIRDDLNKKLEQVKVRLLKGKFTTLTEEQIDSVFNSLKKKFIVNWSEYLKIDPNKHLEKE